MKAPKRLAILVGGGPAPGINSVIGAAAIRAIQDGVEVVGVRDGFKWLMRGDISHVEPLTTDKVSRIHFRGGSYIGIARDNPTKQDKHLENSVTSLLRLNVDKLVTIGGDDTAYTAMKIEEMAAELFRRKFGSEVYENVIEPLFSGIYASDPERMPARHSLSGLLRIERKEGSLLKPALNRLSSGGDTAPPISFEPPRRTSGSRIDSNRSAMSWAEASMLRSVVPPPLEVMKPSISTPRSCSRCASATPNGFARLCPG